MISKGDVVHIAKLARLNLTEQEIEKMQKDLSSILDYFNILKEAKTSKSKFSSSPSFARAPACAEASAGRSAGRQELRNKNVVREDKVLPKDIAKKLIEAAPDKKGGYIKVKAIL